MSALELSRLVPACAFWPLGCPAPFSAIALPLVAITGAKDTSSSSGASQLVFNVDPTSAVRRRHVHRIKQRQARQGYRLKASLRSLTTATSVAFDISMA